MEKPVRQISVAVIARDGKVLAALRPPGGTLGGLWEFPGGKIEPGETPAEAALRECAEELGCAVRALRELPAIRHEYEAFTVEIHPVMCALAGGGDPPRPLAATEIEWLTLTELRGRKIPEANHALLKLIEGLNESALE